MFNSDSFRSIAELFGMKVSDFYLLTKNPDIFYCTYKIPKRSGGYRKLSAPSLRLMAIQCSILNYILKPNFAPLDCCVGFVSDKSILDNVRPHLKRDFIFKTDIKDFFPSISLKKVQQLFLELGYSCEVSRILAKLCCKNYCLPQGAPTSPMISNMILHKIDEKIMNLCKEKELVYTRYADDITISSTKQIDKNLEKEIARLLAEHNMELNYKKTHFYGPKSKKIITGISISSGSPMLPRQTKRAWRQEINMIQKFGLLKHMENTKQLNPLFIPSLKGKLLFWKHIEPTNKFIDKGFIVLDEALKELD